MPWTSAVFSASATCWRSLLACRSQHNHDTNPIPTRRLHAEALSPAFGNFYSERDARTRAARHPTAWLLVDAASKACGASCGCRVAGTRYLFCRDMGGEDRGCGQGACHFSVGGPPALFACDRTRSSVVRAPASPV